MAIWHPGELTPPLPNSQTNPHGIYDVTELLRAAAQADAELPPLPPIPTVLGGQRIEDIRVRGRHWAWPVVTVLAGDEHVAVRIDDELLAEQWIEITFTCEQVAELLARILAVRPMREQAALDVLRSISEQLPR